MKILDKFKSLGKSYYAFLGMDSCVLATIAILQIFISTFILKADLGQNIALIYTAISYGAQPFFMVLATITARKMSPRDSQKIGFIAYAVCFLFIMVLGKTAANYWWFIGLLVSCAAGFYYVSYSFQIIEYTTDENRDAASGVTKMASAVIHIVFPLLSGILLGSFGEGDFTGYRILFGAMLLVVAAEFFANSKLTPLAHVYNPEDKSVKLTGVAKTMLSKKTARLVLLMDMIKGLRRGTLTSFIDILIMAAAMNETWNSVNSTAGQVVALIGAALYGIIVTPNRRKYSIWWATLLISVAAIPLFFAQRFIDAGNLTMYIVLLIIFNVANKGADVFIQEPSQNLYFSIITKMPELQGKAGEVHTVNEFSMAIGEVVGLVITIIAGILFPNNTLVSAIAIICLAASQFFCGMLVGIVQKRLAAETANAGKQ